MRRPASLCDPKDPGECVDLCSRLTRSAPSPGVRSDLPARLRAGVSSCIFRRDTADRPEVVVQGRITDEAGRRVEGAKIGVSFQGTGILDEVSAKDGGYHLRLRAGPWTYAVPRQSPGAGHRGDRAPDREGGQHGKEFPPCARVLHPGRVVSAKGEPIGGVTIHAVRGPDDLSPRVRRRAATMAPSRWAGSTPDATFCAPRNLAGCPKR